MQSIVDRHRSAAAILPGLKFIIGGRDITEGAAGDAAHINPATGREQGRVPLAGPGDIDNAIAAARAAFPGWRDLPAARRRDLLQTLADRLRDEGPALATIAALEHGAARIGVLHGQIPLVHNWITYYAGWADKLDGAYAGGGPFDVVIPEPHGVVAIILPWNGPLQSLAMKAAPALAAGNTVVIKPPEGAPYLAVRFAELARDIGFPDGVINVVIGDPAAGEALVAHRGVDKISFTGSPATARRIAATAAGALTPCLLELGGKSASLVFADADIEAVVTYASTFTFTNAGQICVCPSRLVVHADVYDEVLEQVSRRAGGLAVGDPLADTTFMGPMFTAGARDRVIEFVDRAAARPGVTISTGGRRLNDQDGWFIEPTVVTDPDPASELARTELFGPVVTVHRFTTEAEAIRIANGTDYGLAAYIQTRDINRALRLARAVQAGGIYINGSYPVFNPNLPFGGIGSSGYGREGGRIGIEEFVRPKSVSINVANRADDEFAG